MTPNRCTKDIYRSWCARSKKRSSVVLHWTVGEPTWPTANDERPTAKRLRPQEIFLHRWKTNNGLPPPQGLYDPAHEHDACGIGFVASIRGEKSHQIIEQGIQVLINLTHRGACGCDPETGDGAGLLIQIPHKFFARECETLGFTLPAPGEYAVGMTFLPVEKHPRLNCEGVLERIIREEGLSTLGWRDTPVNGDAIGRVARASQPYIQQIFVARPPEIDEDAFERKLYVVRKRAELEIAESDIEDKEFFYIPSLSARTIVYKGLLLAPQIANFYG